ncbi:hypothetical protein PanWU01x14_141390 [Parasponia andersonii]|uniref:Uncharacterized protein n=1 Tax=Parasponia andersonii TaxID=3476 RepID=A0A2P5CLK3_PARAD|nr:hypothetical protein PanWU01x14_141390 [Parasponia andersonii]
MDHETIGCCLLIAFVKSSILLPRLYFCASTEIFTIIG